MKPNNFRNYQQEMKENGDLYMDYEDKINGQEVKNIELLERYESADKGGYEIWLCTATLADGTEVEGSVWYHYNAGEVLNGSFEPA